MRCPQQDPSCRWYWCLCRWSLYRRFSEEQCKDPAWCVVDGDMRTHNVLVDPALWFMTSQGLDHCDLAKIDRCMELEHFVGFEA